MSCSCHINPPCSYCTESYECKKCEGIFHPEDREPTYDEETNMMTCHVCMEEAESK